MLIFRLLLKVTFLVIIVSCSTERPKGKTEAEVLFKEAQELRDEGRYLLAIEKLNAIKNQYTYSYYAKPSELMHADILFLQESYIEAASSYMLYRDFHPKDEQIEYVIFKIAESYYFQIPETFDRDLQSAYEALKYYGELLEKYPDSQYKKEVNFKVKKCNEMLRDKDLYIADFYFRTEVYQASRFWYKDILKKYTEKDIIELATVRSIRSAYLRGNLKECLTDAKEYDQYVDKETRLKINEIKEMCVKELKEKPKKENS